MKKKIIGMSILVVTLLMMIGFSSACSTGEESPKQENTSTAANSKTATSKVTPELKLEVKPETKPEDITTSETKPDIESETTASETKPETKSTESLKSQTPAIDQSSCKHQWPDWTITKLPTATTTGTKERMCPICGAKETEVMPVDAQEGGNTDHWGERISEHNYDGTITQAQFDEFVSYAASQGFAFSNSTAYHTDYDLDKSGTIFPSFAITNSTGAIDIMVWISSDSSGSDDHRLCHNIDQLYEFFNLYKN